LIEGVKAAHAAGLIHRDLKPENVMIGVGERIKVLDFGLAKFATGFHDVSGLTVSGSLLGTAGYMSYEQLMGQEADERSDIFALGVMAAEALTGQRPFGGKTLAELAGAISRAEWRLPAAEAVRATLVRSLARDPRERFATAAELQRELIPAVRACAVEQIAAEGGSELSSTLSLGPSLSD